MCFNFVLVMVSEKVDVLAPGLANGVSESFRESRCGSCLLANTILGVRLGWTDVTQTSSTHSGCWILLDVRREGHDEVFRLSLLRLVMS